MSDQSPILRLLQNLDEAALQWLFNRAISNESLDHLLRETRALRDENNLVQDAAVVEQLRHVAKSFLTQTQHQGQSYALDAPVDSERDDRLVKALNSALAMQHGDHANGTLLSRLYSLIGDDDDVEIEREQFVTFHPKGNISRSTSLSFPSKTTSNEPLGDDLPDGQAAELIVDDASSHAGDDIDASKEVTLANRELIKIKRREKKSLQKIEKIRDELQALKGQNTQLKKEKQAASEQLQDYENKLRKVSVQRDDMQRYQDICRYKDTVIEGLEQERNALVQRLEHFKSQEKEYFRLREKVRQLEEENISLRTGLITTLEDVIRERQDLLNKLNSTRVEVLSSLERVENERVIQIDHARSQRQPGNPQVGLFVDVQNMFYAARKRFNGKLDYQRLLEHTTRGRSVAKSYAYIIQTPEVDQSSFIALLERCGYCVRSKELKTRLDGSAKGDWDMEIAMDIISVMQQLDVVILVSGDGDFVPLLQMLKKHGLQVEVASFEYNTAMELRETADVFMPIGEELILE